MRRGGMILAALAVATVALAAGPANGPYDPSLDGEKQLQQAGAQAKAGGKRVFIVVGGNWCKWCRALDALIVANEPLRHALEKDFVLVQLNYSKENKNKPVLERLGNPDKLGFPVFVVVSSDLQVLMTQSSEGFETGDKERPGHDPAKLIAFLTQWSGRG